MANYGDHSCFNPRSPCGERRFWTALLINWPRKEFQSTLPVWGATLFIFHPRFGSSRFQSTLPVWGATQCRWRPRSPECFNPRSPCGERPGLYVTSSFTSLFQSTLPVWGATRSLRHQMMQMCFNPRSPCGERLGNVYGWSLHSTVSIHAPRVGSDAKRDALAALGQCFNPRSPCGERPSLGFSC